MHYSESVSYEVLTEFEELQFFLLFPKINYRRQSRKKKLNQN